jgi:succinate dehydrogenase/fumarate reductase flavoprotein subunit
MASLAYVLNHLGGWASSADLVICGYGCAGASAAIEAHDQFPDASVLIVEKAPEHHRGGNCRVSGQSLLISHDPQALAAYQHRMSEANPLPEGMIELWAERMCGLEPWIKKIAADAGREFLRGTGFTEREAVLEFPDLGAADAVAYTSTILPIPSGVWEALDINVTRRNVPVRYNTRLVDLVQDPDTLEVLGIVVEQDGQREAIQACRGVIMATGGFEADAQMQRDYFGLSHTMPLGTPYNTGDGLRIQQKAGADMWHLRNQGQSGGIWPGIAKPGKPTLYLRNFLLPAFSWFDVDATGERFYSETDELQLTHYKRKMHGRYVDVPIHLAQPMWMIFDETTRLAGKLVMEIMTWSALVEGSPWSDDNGDEVNSGLIQQAPDIRSLAKQINLPAERLEATYNVYQAACGGGQDKQWGRKAETLLPLTGETIYAVPITPAIVCTGGGAKRSLDGHVFGHDGLAIPRLFSAGELGSMFSDLYQNGSYLTEAMITGRAAACSALSLSGWC